MLRRLLFSVAVATLLPGAVLASVPADTVIDYPSVWQCDTTKFNWYCQDEEPTPEAGKAQQPEKKAKTPEEQALEELERWRKELEAKRALAIMRPTPENLKGYIAAQEAMMDRASVFSDVWRRVVWQHPELNYQLRNPVNNAAIQVRDEARTRKERTTITEIGKEWGLFFLFRSDCQYCHRMAPSLKFLSDAYGISVFPVSLDGAGLPDFPTPARDNGMSQVLGVKQVPFVVLGNIKDRRLIPLGSGVLSAQDVVERIYVLTRTKPGELY